jgi:regulatory protein
MKEKKFVTEKIAISRLMQLCSRTEKSTCEIRKILARWGLEQEADRIIKHLSDEKYIDDSRFATAFVHDKIFINKWGRMKVKYLLKQQQISESVIVSVLNAVDPAAYRSMIFNELTKKKNMLKKYPTSQITLKLFRFGSQRGYELDLIHRFTEKK